ncbi:MAG: DUF4185 domain-containing protein [Terracidiphilus sp.]
MKFSVRSSALSGLLLLSVACNGALTHAAKPQCTPEFPLQHGMALGWLGADAAYSVPLPDGRDVWIFGDTLYGEHRVVNNNVPAMVRNSIGISTCQQGHWKLDYVIRKDSQGHPADFFKAQHPNTWYWALDGFVSGNQLWVTLLCVRNAPAQTAAMGFETCGTDLARVAWKEADPQSWKIDYFPLVQDGAHAYPSATAVVDGGYAYIFALMESGTRPLLATRIPLEGLSDPAKNLQYLATDGQWHPGFDPAQAQPVMEKGSPELSIRYHPERKQWVAVMFEPDAFSSKILLRTAPSLMGPWTQGEVIYQVPEMQPQSPGYDKNTFCYAGKEHPEFERGDLLFTYVCNTFDVPRLATNLDIYFPRVVRLAMPPQ